jgi:hypothetical protein
MEKAVQRDIAHSNTLEVVGISIIDNGIKLEDCQQDDNELSKIIRSIDSPVRGTLNPRSRQKLQTPVDVDVSNGTEKSQTRAESSLPAVRGPRNLSALLTPVLKSKDNQKEKRKKKNEKLLDREKRIEMLRKSTEW